MKFSGPADQNFDVPNWLCSALTCKPEMLPRTWYCLLMSTLNLLGIHYRICYQTFVASSKQVTVPADIKHKMPLLELLEFHPQQTLPGVDTGDNFIIYYIRSICNLDFRLYFSGLLPGKYLYVAGYLGGKKTVIHMHHPYICLQQAQSTCFLVLFFPVRNLIYRAISSFLPL